MQQKLILKITYWDLHCTLWNFIFKVSTLKWSDLPACVFNDKYREKLVSFAQESPLYKRFPQELKGVLNVCYWIHLRFRFYLNFLFNLGYDSAINALLHLIVLLPPTVQGKASKLRCKVEEAFYRIVQIHNVSKHSKLFCRKYLIFEIF